MLIECPLYMMSKIAPEIIGTKMIVCSILLKCKVSVLDSLVEIITETFFRIVIRIKI